MLDNLFCAESEGFEPPELNKGHPFHFQYRENLD